MASSMVISAISHARVHPARREHALGIEALLHAPGHRGEAWLLRLEHRPRHGSRPARGSASRGRRRQARRARALRPSSRPAAPPRPARRPSRRRFRPPRSLRRPHGRARAQSRCATADGARPRRTAPRRARRQSARDGLLRTRHRAEGFEQRGERPAVIATDGATPSSRNGWPCSAPARPSIGRGAGKCAAPDTSLDEFMAALIAARRRIVEAETSTVASVSAWAAPSRSHRSSRRACHESRQHLAEIVAGDVLDHAAARLEGLAAPRHRVTPRKWSRAAPALIRRGPNIRRSAPPIVPPPGGRRTPGRSPSARRRARWSFPRAASRSRRRGAGARREDQFLGLIERHAGKPREIEAEIGPGWAAQGRASSPAR